MDAKEDDEAVNKVAKTGTEMQQTTNAVVSKKMSKSTY